MINCYRRSGFLIFFLVIFGSLQGQVHWVRSSGGFGYEDVVAVDYDGTSGIVAAGHFNTSFSLGVFPFVTNGLSDVFVVSYDQDGNFRWARPFGGAGDERATAVKVAPSGEIIVTGTFTQNFTAGNTLLTCLGQKDVFLIRIHPTGQILSATSFGGTGNEEAYDVDVDPSGNIVLVGSFKGQSKFGNQTITSTLNPITQNTGTDPFILSLNAAWSVNWVKTGQSPLNDSGLEIETDAVGNIYAAGQCSDTIQFNQSYPNAANNAIWILKVSTNGSEVWFRTISGSTKSILRGLEVSAAGDIYLGGEAGNNCLFSGPVNAVLNTTYPNAAFVARYSNTGLINWISSEGSVQDLDVSALALDSQQRVWIAGRFRCQLNSLSDDYGQGRFRSTGYRDIWLSAYDSSGQRTYAQQLGGQGEEVVVSMTDAGGRLVLAGSYDRRIIIPSTINFTKYDGVSDLSGITTGLICADSSHGRFVVKPVAGGTDFFFGPCIDLQRDVYDFYGRQIEDCSFPPSVLCVGSGSDQNCGGDTISGCGAVSLSAATNTNAGASGDTLSTAGPFFQYLWSNGNTSPVFSTAFDGSFTVTVTTEDGCFSATASAYADVFPVPSTPFISDNLGVNNNAFLTQPVRTCVPDTIRLYASNTGGWPFFWEANGVIYTDSVFTWIAAQTDSFNVTLVVTNTFGCVAANSVFVAADSLLTTIAPALFASAPDTLLACTGGSVEIWVADTLTDPLGEESCNLGGFSFTWSSVPSANIIPTCAGGQSVSVLTLQSGWYTLTCSIIRSTLCGGTDSFTVSKSVYVTFYPPPVVQAGIGGANTTDVICPGEFKTLTASGGYFYSWTGPGVQMPYNDSVLVVNEPGQYCVIVTDSSNDGCIGSAISCVTLTSPAIPVLMATSSLLCPGDSIALTAAGGVSYIWYSPSGPLPDTGAVIYGSEGGYYYVYALDTSGCTLVSNAVELQQYATPAIFAQPVAVICNGTPVTLQLSTNNGSVINWLPPLSGTLSEQVVSTPGTYQCSVTSCGITTLATLQVTSENIQVNVTPSGPLQLCENDTIQLTAGAGFNLYQWIPGNENLQTITITAAGTYSVFVVSASGCTDTSNAVLVSAIASPVIPLINAPDSVCEGDEVTFSAQAGTGIFSWSGPDGFTSSQLSVVIDEITLKNDGWYFATIDSGQCSSSAGFYLHVIQRPEPEIILSGEVCEGQQIELSSANTNGTIIWTLADGSERTDSLLMIGPLSTAEEGWYILSLTRFGCAATDSVLVLAEECDLIMPNIFTPNGDQLNDVFSAISGGSKLRSMRIFNRWGDVVFSGGEQGWNGRSAKGEELPEGTYYYRVVLKNGKTISGHFELIR